MRRLTTAAAFLLAMFPSFVFGWQTESNSRPRLRDLGIGIGVLPPGKHNAITDVQGVMVGHQTMIEGDGVRTGVTIVRPHAGNVFLQKVPAAFHVANGFGKFVGSTQVQELGVLETPIALTNTLSTFSAANALVGYTLNLPGCEDVRSVNPVVGECNDGYLNDIRARHVADEDVLAAVAAARDGPVEEGCVGAGTGVRCMGWKSGIGTSSRMLPDSLGGFTIGVLVQTNFGGSLTIDGVPVGRELGRYYLKDEVRSQEHGSCIVVVATDAPLDARRLERLARRAPLGLGSAGSSISHGSGDYVIAFSTNANLRIAYQSEEPIQTDALLRDDEMSPLFQAVKDATEEAVVNSILQATTTVGYRGHTVEAVDPQRVRQVLRKYGRVDEPDDGLGHMSNPRIYHGLSDSLERRLNTFELRLPDLMQEHHVPGVSLALIEGNRLAWSRGYGMGCADCQTPMQPDTVMEACSMSKPFFAYCFLKLVEQGQFELDRPLVEYLGQDYLADVPEHRSITARMVLSHTSGLPNWRPGGWRAGGPMSLAFKPGAAFRYSGEGFLMLQRAVEAAMRTELDAFSRRRLIDPLGLARTRFVWDESLEDNAACGHDGQGNEKSGRNYYDRANAAFTLYTTAEDYARFIVEVMQPERTADHSLSRAVLDQMFTPHSRREEQDADWGLGWGMRSVDGQRLIYHGGSNGSGFRCYSEFQPDLGRGLVLMTNAVGGKKLWNQAIDQWHKSDP